MNVFLSNDKLSRKVLKLGSDNTQLRQMSARLRKLLPMRLSELVREHKRDSTAGKANRLALADERYEATIDEFLEMSGSSFETRILWETHIMLVNARKSMRSMDRYYS